MANTNMTQNLKGRIFGVQTRDGRRFNARLVRETPHYITIADNNQRGLNVKLSKGNIRNINCG